MRSLILSILLLSGCSFEGLSRIDAAGVTTTYYPNIVAVLEPADHSALRAVARLSSVRDVTGAFDVSGGLRLYHAADTSDLHTALRLLSRPFAAGILAVREIPRDRGSGAEEMVLRPRIEIELKGRVAGAAAERTLDSLLHLAGQGFDTLGCPTERWGAGILSYDPAIGYHIVTIAARLRTFSEIIAARLVFETPAQPLRP